MVQNTDMNTTKTKVDEPIYVIDGCYFSASVERPFGENRLVAGQLVLVMPINDYVREHGREVVNEVKQS